MRTSIGMLRKLLCLMLQQSVPEAMLLDSRPSCGNHSVGPQGLDPQHSAVCRAARDVPLGVNLRFVTVDRQIAGRSLRQLLQNWLGQFPLSLPLFCAMTSHAA